MGTCVSVHGNIKLLKKNKNIKPITEKNKNIQQNYNHSSSSVRISRYSRPIKILKDPSGDDILKKYELGKELGRGEFGITYKCVDKETGESFACKTISKSKLRTEVDIEDIRREVQIMSRLRKHPHIVGYKEVYEDKDVIYLVMELCEGGELFDRIVAKGHFTDRATALVTKTIVEVIKVCHEHGVIHRDLKPENFLYGSMDEKAPLKVVDFGLSVFFEPGENLSEIVGSPYYMAPEVLRRNYGPEVDVWSAGVILYILLCGVPPFWAETEEGIAHAIVKGEIDFEKDPWPKVSEDAKDLVNGMLEQNPYSRLTIQEVLGMYYYAPKYQVMKSNVHRITDFTSYLHEMKNMDGYKNADKVPNVSLGENVRTRIKQFSLMNKFKKKVLRVVVGNLPDEKLDDIKQMFYKMDADNNGNLSFQELKDGLSMIDEPFSDPDVQMLMDAADVDGDGMLNCKEFVTILVHLKRINCDEHLCQAFKYFDKNENGYIELDELRETLLDKQHHQKFGPNNEDDKAVQDIILDVDLDKESRISYEEFRAMMTNGMDWKMGSRRSSRAMLNALSVKLFKDKSLQLKN